MSCPDTGRVSWRGAGTASLGPVGGRWMDTWTWAVCRPLGRAAWGRARLWRHPGSQEGEGYWGSPCPHLVPVGSHRTGLVRHPACGGCWCGGLRSKPACTPGLLVSSDLAGSEEHFCYILEPIQGGPHTCLLPGALAGLKCCIASWAPGRRVQLTCFLIQVPFGAWPPDAGTS